MSDVERTYTGTPTDVIDALQRDGSRNARTQIWFRRILAASGCGAILAGFLIYFFGWWPSGLLLIVCVTVTLATWNQGRYYRKPLDPLRRFLSEIGPDIDPQSPMRMRCRLRHPLSDETSQPAPPASNAPSGAKRAISLHADDWLDGSLTLRDGTVLGWRHSICIRETKTFKRKRTKNKYKVVCIYNLTARFPTRNYRALARPVPADLTQVAINAGDKRVVVRVARREQGVYSDLDGSQVERVPLDADMLLRMAELAFRQVHRREAGSK